MISKTRAIVFIMYVFYFVWLFCISCINFSHSKMNFIILPECEVYVSLSDLHHCFIIDVLTLKMPRFNRNISQNLQTKIETVNQRGGRVAQANKETDKRPNGRE